jgi:Putative Actinobacterial Holin-X, holin superfamily III
MATAGPAADEPTLGALVASASSDVSSLVRSEIALAKTEIAQDVKAAAKGGGMLGVAGFLGVVAFVLLSIAAAYGLFALGLPRWLAFVIVAVVYLLVAGLLALLARRALTGIKPPERTARTVKETVAVLKNRGAAR